MDPVEVGQFLEINSRVCHGQLIFKGTRVPVETILNRLAWGRTVEELLAGWPELTREAVGEAVQLAAAALLERHAAQTAAARQAALKRRAAQDKVAHEPNHSGRS